MLLVKVGHLQYLIHSSQVHYIDYSDTVTLLPFASCPVEGLAKFNDQPLLQVNLAQALSIPEQSGEKRLIVATHNGDIALRVDQVLNFTNTDTESAPIPPVLTLHQIMPWLVDAATVDPVQNHAATDIEHPRSRLTVLLVTLADKVLALLSETVFYIEEIEALQVLEYQGLEPDLLLKVKNTLLPGYSLGRFLHHPQSPNLSHKAVIIHAETNSWALVVDQVLGLETVETAYSISKNNAGLWYITQNGEIREIINPNQLIGLQDQTGIIANVEPHWTRPAVQMLNQVSTEGLRIYCGKGSYMLPLALASKTLDAIENELLGKRRAGMNLSGFTDRIPWIDLGQLLFNEHQGSSNYGVLISLSDQVHAVLGVEKALLQLPLITQQWLPLTNLPPTTALFFDAASYDEDNGQWVLRVTAKIEFAKLPWAQKKNIVRAISGWFDLTTVLSLNGVAQPTPLYSCVETLHCNVSTG